MEHMIRACLIALRLAESAAIDDAERGVVYYSGLLAWVGCHTDAYEQTKGWPTTRCGGLQCRCASAA